MTEEAKTPSHLVDEEIDDEFDNFDDRDEVANDKDVLTDEHMLQLLKDRLARRNHVLESVRRAYYRDVITIKQELELQAKDKDKYHPSEHLHQVPSVDLRNSLILFSPADTLLRIQPCAECGGQLEIVHTETTELKNFREQIEASQKSEQQQKNLVHRLRNELQHAGEIADALKQRLKNVQKENDHYLEQMQRALTKEKETKQGIATLKSKLQTAGDCQNELANLKAHTKQVESTLATVEVERDNLFNTHKHQEAEIKNVKERLRHEVDARMLLDVNLRDAKQQGDTLKKKGTEMEARIGTLEQELAASSEDGTRKSELLAEKSEQLVQLKQQLDRIKRSNEAMLQTEEAAQDSLRDKVTQAKKDAKHLKKQLEKQKQLVEEKQNETQALQEHLEQIQQKQSTAQNNLDAHIIELEFELKSKSSRIERLTMGNNDLWTRLFMMQTMLTDLEDELEQVRENVGELQTAVPVAVQATPEQQQQQQQQQSAVESPPPPQAPTETQPPSETSSTGPARAMRRRTSVCEKPGGKSIMKQMNDALQAENKEKQNEINELKRFIEQMKDKEAALHETIQEMEKTQELMSSSIANLEAAKKANDGARSAQDTHTEKLLADAQTQLGLVQKAHDWEEKRHKSISQVFQAIYDAFCEYNNEIDTLVDQAIAEDEPKKKKTLKPKKFSGMKNLNADIQARRLELQKEKQLEQEFEQMVAKNTQKCEIMKQELATLLERFATKANDFDELQTKFDQVSATLANTTIEIRSLTRSIEKRDSEAQDLKSKLKSVVKESSSKEMEIDTLQKKLKTVNAQRAALADEKRRVSNAVYDLKKDLDVARVQKEQNIANIQKLRADLVTMTDLKSKIDQEKNEMIQANEARLASNVSIGISVHPETNETSMQTDLWKPLGLQLRQRNSRVATPQRIQCKPIMVSSASMDTLPTSTRGLPVSSASLLPIPKHNAFADETDRLPKVRPQTSNYRRETTIPTLTSPINNNRTVSLDRLYFDDDL